MEKKLYKSTKDKKLCGVCGGIAEYINLDPTVVRLLWVLFCFVGAGILAYIVVAIVMPEQPAEGTEAPAAEKNTAAEAPESAPAASAESTDGAGNDHPEQI